MNPTITNARKLKKAQYQLAGIYLKEQTEYIQIQIDKNRESVEDRQSWIAWQTINEVSRRKCTAKAKLKTAHKWCTPTYGQAKAERAAGIYIQQLCEDTGCSHEDLPGSKNDREKWRERVRDIHTNGTTWWWWEEYFEHFPVIYFPSLWNHNRVFLLSIHAMAKFSTWLWTYYYYYYY